MQIRISHLATIRTLLYTCLSTIHNNRERCVHNYEKQWKESSCRQYFKIVS